MTVLISIYITLTAIGLINAVYLSWKHYTKKPLYCPLNQKCNEVLDSKWSNMLPIRNELLGVFYYIAIIILIILYFFNKDYKIKIIMTILTSIGLLFSLILFWIQARIIKNYCFYCIISAIISLLLFINTLAL